MLCDQALSNFRTALLLLTLGLGFGCASPSGSETAVPGSVQSPLSETDDADAASAMLREIFHLDGTQAHLARVQLVDAIVANSLIKLSAGLSEEAKPSDDIRKALETKLTEKIRKAYADRALSEELVEQWSPTADILQLKKIRMHLRGDLFQRYLARLAEIKSSTGQRKLGIFLAQTTKRGLEPEKVNLARRWLQATQERELLYLLSYELSEEIFATAKPLLVDWAGDSYQSFQSDIDARDEAFRARVEKSLFYETLFAFDHFSKTEQDALVSFWESSEGFSYVKKKLSMVRTVLQQAHLRFHSEVSEGNDRGRNRPAPSY